MKVCNYTDILYTKLAMYNPKMENKHIVIASIENDNFIEVQCFEDECTVTFQLYHEHFEIPEELDDVLLFISMIISRQKVVILGIKGYPDGVICCSPDLVDEYIIQTSLIYMW